MKRVKLHESALHDIVAEAPDLAPSTRQKYLRDLNAWVEFAGTDPAGWTPASAQKFYNRLLKTMQPQSANRLLASVQYASRWWSQREGVSDFALIRKGKVHGQAKREHIEPEDAAELLRACDHSPLGVRDFAIMVLGLETGMRRMSIAGLGIDGFETKPYPNVRVPMKGHGGELVPVPISDTALAAIAPWRTWLGAKRGALFRPLTRQLDRNGFAWREGPAGLSTSAIYKLVARRAASVNLEIHPHLFRHTFITWRTLAGYAPHEVASVTGHTVAGIGALGGYIDMQAIGLKMRESTPAWLAELVQHRLLIMKAHS